MTLRRAFRAAVLSVCTSIPSCTRWTQEGTSLGAPLTCTRHIRQAAGAESAGWKQ